MISNLLNDYSQATVCVVDNGLFTDFAATLTQWFGRVLLYVPTASPWPTTAQVSVGRGLGSQVGIRTATNALVGHGLPGVEKIDDPLLLLDAIDLFVFPDLYQAPLQVHLRQLGKRVFGSAFGEEVELDRLLSKDILQAQGLPVGPYEVVVGTDRLRARLRQGPGIVKVSRTRGDFETFLSLDYALSDLVVMKIEHVLGPMRYVKEFIVEEPLAVADMAEIGYDGIVVDGQWSGGLVGLEMKDKAYACKYVEARDMPEQLQLVNDALSPTFEELQYRNFFSTEVFIERQPMPNVAGRGYLIDPCCRFGSPPGALMQRLFTNLPDILWYGAEGTLVEPKPAGLYGAQLQIIRPLAQTEWTALEYPSDLRSRLFFHFPLMVDGRMYTLPLQYENPAVAAAIGWGDSLEAAIQDALRVATSVRGHGLQPPADALAQGAAALEELTTFGITL